MDELTAEQARVLDLILDPHAEDDYYAMLELPNELSLTEPIKQNYRRMSLLLHPDKNPDPRATEAFQKLVTAYEALNTEEKLGQYDLNYILRRVFPPIILETLGPDPQQELQNVKLALQDLPAFARIANIDFLFGDRTPEDWARIRFQMRGRPSKVEIRGPPSKVDKHASQARGDIEASDASSETEASEVGNETVSGTFRDILTRFLTVPNLVRLFFLLMHIYFLISFILHTGSLVQKISNEFIWNFYTVGPEVYSTRSMILSTLYHSINFSEVYVCLKYLLHTISPQISIFWVFRLIPKIGDYFGIDAILLR